MKLSELEDHLAGSIELLGKAVDSIQHNFKGEITGDQIKLPSGILVPISYNSHRIIHDSFHLLFGEGLLELVKSLSSRINIAKDALDLAFSRTLSEVGIKKTTVFFKLEQNQVITEAILLEIISHHIVFGNINEAQRLLNEESGNVNEKVVEIIKESLEDSNKIGKNGTYHKLNNLSGQKIESVFNTVRSEVYSHKTLQTIELGGVEVMFSNVLHGNMIALRTLLSSKRFPKMKHLLLTNLLRVSLYSAEQIAGKYAPALIPEIEETINKINWHSLRPTDLD
jgi:hypothetical protein